MGDRRRPSTTTLFLTRDGSSRNTPTGGLQDRVSALKELANDSREQLYILFAKLSGELCEPCRAEEETPTQSWPEGRRIIKE